MSTCIIHIGMHKTGSSSIQKTLHKFLRSEDFVYADIVPSSNHAVAMHALFSQKPSDYPLFKTRGWDAHKVMTYKREVQNILDNFINHSHGRNVIISGENIPTLSAGALLNMKKYFENTFDDIIVVGYVRSPKSFMESFFQEGIKTQRNAFNLETSYPNYRRRFKKFYDLFSPDKVRLWKFNPSVFPQGCVVRDFCARLGIDINPEKIMRTNEGLSREAISILYAYRKYGAGFGVGQEAISSNRHLVDLVSKIPGSKLRFSPELVAPILEKNRADIAWMEEKLGESLSEDMGGGRGDDIACEEDLLKYDKNVISKLVQLINKEKRHIQKDLGTFEEDNIKLNDGKAVAKSVQSLREAIEAKIHTNSKIKKNKKTEVKKEDNMLNQKEFTEKLKDRISQRFDKPAVINNARAVVDEFIQLITDELKNSGEVRIPKLGVLKVVERPAGMKTEAGTDVKIPARKVIRFAMAKQLKEVIDPDNK